MSKFLVVDTETGGFSPAKHSILSFGAVVWDNGVIGESLHIHIAEPEIVAVPQALAVNKIDIGWLEENGMSPHHTVQAIDEFLVHNFSDDELRAKITLIGHNVPFELTFIQRLYRLANKNFHDVFSYQAIDTLSLVWTLIAAGKMDVASGKADDVFRYFGIEMLPEERHTALGDAKATAEMFSKLVKMMG